MTRNEQILSEVQKRFSSNDTHLVSKISTFIDGAKWADEYPNSKNVYTKQQLMDMGYAFTTNGDIVTPDQSNEDLKKYLEYRKQKFIEKAVKYLEANFPDIENVGGWYKESFINNFRKAMEE